MLGFVKDSPQSSDDTASSPTGSPRALDFMRAIGIDPETHPEMRITDFYTSHEALLLGYEEAMTRVDSTSGDWYATSGHLIWIGDRTRQLDHAHVEYLRGIKNPIGLKCGPSLVGRRAPAAHRRPQPRERAGTPHPDLPLRRRQGVRQAAGAGARGEARRPRGRVVVRPDARQHHQGRLGLQDPAVRGDHAARSADFFSVHQAEGTHAGGMHLEMTGKPVTECTGGARALPTPICTTATTPICDPRLNAEQALEMAFLTAELIKRERQGRERPRVEAAE